jgi:hypothetical protein
MKQYYIYKQRCLVGCSKLHRPISIIPFFSGVNFILDRFHAPGLNDSQDFMDYLNR